jgi:hypothetical protein
MRHHKPVVLIAAILFGLLILSCGSAWGAVGCDLNDPVRDVPRLFPESTGYQKVTVSIYELGGDRLLAQVEAKLRDKLRGLYEKIDVPYEVYVIYKGEEKIGYIHGVNQRGRYGAIQIFLALDLEQRIRELYIQRMRGGYAGKLRSAEFTGQFAGLTLSDFDDFDVATGRASGKLAAISNPAPEAGQDFRLLLRGMKKNLVLVSEFIALKPELSASTGGPAP